MTPLAWDTETALIRPAQLAPPLVCVTWQRPGLDARIRHHTDAEPLLRGWLADRDALLVGHNIAYDMAVVCEAFPALRPLVFKAYDDDRVTDTMIRAQLLDIAAGTYRGRPVGNGVFIKPKYGLDDVADRVAGIKLQKDAWRLSYGKLRPYPIEKWPAKAIEIQAEARVRLAELRQAIVERRLDATKKDTKNELEGLEAMIASPPDQCVKYPLDDARATLAVFLAQERHAAWLENQYDQARASFALYLSSAWGLRTDERGVEILRAEVSAELAEVEEELMQLGFIVDNGKKRTKKKAPAQAQMIEVCRREGLDLRRTESHPDYHDGNPSSGKCKRLDGTVVQDGHDDCEVHVALDADACEVTDDPVLLMYAEHSTLKKVLSNDVTALARGVMWPVHTRYGLAETGRTTSSKPNIQNWVRSRSCAVCDGEGEIAEAA